MKCHALFVPCNAGAEKIRTWCGVRCINHPDDYVACSPEAISCPKCIRAIRAAYAGRKAIKLLKVAMPEDLQWYPDVLLQWLEEWGPKTPNGDSA